MIRKKRKKMTAVPGWKNSCCLFLAVVWALTANAEHGYAASQKTISSVYLYITSEIEAGTQIDSVRVISESNRCWVDEAEVTNVPRDDWEWDDKPRLKIILRADEDYVFASGISKKKINLSGDGGTVTSVSRKGEDQLVIRVTLNSLDGYEGVHSLEVEELEWNETTGYAYWEEAGDAKRYEVRLFRDDKEVTGSTIKTSNTYYDFSPRLTRNGFYYFKVRAVYNREEKGDWKTSERWYVSSADAALLSDGKAIQQAVSVNPAASWRKIGQSWYYYDDKGHLATGWMEVDGKWYYLDPESGAMYENTVTPDGYTVGADGAWIP